MHDLLRQHVLAAATRKDVVRAVHELYADLQREIDNRRPRCEASGRCCRFEEFGHRLYVTTIELAAFLADRRSGQSPATLHWDGTGCPYQVDGLCSVHAIRPFGCRIFFCDASSSDWQRVQYERFHARIKRLHEDMGIAYLYVEWREALAALNLAHGPNNPKSRTLSLPQLRL
jgi:Fe-S-cluster containining protein